MAGKFFRPGVSKIYICPAVAGSNPTTPELNAGTDITPDLADVNNISVKSNLVDTPDFASNFTTKVVGADQIGDPELVYWDRDNATTNRTALAKGTVGVLVLMPYGRVSGKRCELYAVTSAGVNDQWDHNTPAQFSATLAVTAPPSQSAVLP